MIGRYPHDPGPYDDDWEDQPAQSWFHKWVLGVLLPAAIFWYGIGVIANGVGEMIGRGSMIVRGPNATAYGLSLIAVTIFLHCHYFWGNIYDQVWFAALGKIVSACMFIAATVYLLVEIGVLGKH